MAKDRSATTPAKTLEDALRRGVSAGNRDQVTTRGVSRRNDSARNPVAGDPTVSMTSTEAKNGFGRVLEAVARDGTVLITRHDSPQAVVISYERYQALTRGADTELDALEAEYDHLIAKMQMPEAVEGALQALRASPEDLSRIAVDAVKARKRTR